MDINPLSLLEVTMTPDPVEEDDDDDDCVIIDPPIETHVIDDVPDPEIPEQEQEMLSTAGLHFMEQTDERLEDPLSLNAKRIPSLWVTSSINSLNNVTTLELEFRKSHYPDVQSVLNDKLHCTICQEHVGCDIRAHPTSIEHPILKVLVCEKCCITYKKYHFVLNDNGKETRCRWCGKSPMGGGAPLKRCDNCPFSFCQSCLQKNFPPAVNKVYACCICDMKMLWPARSLLWALQTLMNHLLSRPSTSNFGAQGDISLCCVGKHVKKVKGQVPSKVYSGPAKNSARDTGKKNATQVLIRPKMYQLSTVSNQTVSVVGSKQMKLIRIPHLVEPSSNRLPVVIKPPKKTHPPPPPPPRHLSPLAVREERIMATPSPDQFANTCCDNDLMNTVWLKEKIGWYRNDLSRLSLTLERMNNDLAEVETLKTIESKIQDITNLLLMNSNLLKDSSANFMNEWRERKSRCIIEKIHSPSTSNSGRVSRQEPHSSQQEPHSSQQELPPRQVKPTLRSRGKSQETPSRPETHLQSPSIKQFPHLRALIKQEAVSYNVQKTQNQTKKPKKPKRLTFPKKYSANSTRNSRPLSKQQIQELCKAYNIKECSVVLTRYTGPNWNLNDSSSLQDSHQEHT